jgi:hypothetical protein
VDTLVNRNTIQFSSPTISIYLLNCMFFVMIYTSFYVAPSWRQLRTDEWMNPKVETFRSDAALDAIN